MQEVISGIEVIALDAVGTLIHTVQPVAKSYVDVAAKHGVHLSQTEVAERFSKAIARHSVDFGFDSPGLATSEAIERAWWRNFIAEVLQIDSDQAHVLFDDLWDYFAQPSAWRLYDDAIEFIAFLEKRRILWVIASNFDARLHRICAANPHLSKAKSVFVSSEVLWRKPSIHFFRHVATELSCKPSSILMIGDDLIADFEAARNASLQAIRLRRNGAAEPGELTNLADVPRRIQFL